MKTYRSLQTIEAEQYTGTPIADVTCEPRTDPKEETARRENNGCDSSRANLPHAHTSMPGGLTVLRHGDWISRVPGGPFTVIPDLQFRATWEVPAATPVLEPEKGKGATPPAPVQDIPASPRHEDQVPEPTAAEAPRASASGKFGGKTRSAGG